VRRRYCKDRAIGSELFIKAWKGGRTRRGSRGAENEVREEIGD